MKHSASITLLLLGSTAVACTPDNPDVKEGIYATPDECRAAGRTTVAPSKDDECEKGFQFAKEEHERTAPRFQTKAECEAQWGQCGPNSPTPAQPQQSVNSWFIPYMMGYMMGGGGSSHTTTPVYIRNDDDYRRGTGSPTYVKGGSSAAAGTVLRARPKVDAPPASTRPSAPNPVTAKPSPPGPTPAAAKPATRSSPQSSRGGFGGSAGAGSSGG